MLSAKIEDVRRMIHSLREPLGALAIHIELLERSDLLTEAQSTLKSMRASMDRASAAFEEIDFVLGNGHTRETSTRSR